MCKAIKEMKEGYANEVATKKECRRNRQCGRIHYEKL